MLKLTDREMAIAKIAWSQGYGYGHNHTVEGHYAPPEDYYWDILMEQLADGVFDDIPPNTVIDGRPQNSVSMDGGLLQEKP